MTPFINILRRVQWAEFVKKRLDQKLSQKPCDLDDFLETYETRVVPDDGGDYLHLRFICTPADEEQFDDGDCPHEVSMDLWREDWAALRAYIDAWFAEHCPTPTPAPAHPPRPAD